MRRKLTATERKLLQKDEERILANIDKLPGDRRLIAEAAARQRHRADLKKAKVGEVGLFFVVDGKVVGEGEPFTDVLPHAGFRTYDVDHDKFLFRLQSVGIAPRNVDYVEIPRGRVTYEDSTRRFTLFADKHIIQSKRLLDQVMRYFNLPSNTKVLTDSHYRCPECLSGKRNKKQEEKDWDI